MDIAYLRERVERLETEIMALRTTMYQMLADLRKDVHSSVTPVGLELTEKRADDRRVLATLNDILTRLGRLESWIADDRDERPARQEALDLRLAAIERAQATPRQVWPIVVPWALLALMLGIVIGVVV